MWAYPYMLVTGIGGWRSHPLDLVVPWLWPLLWLVLLAARVARTVISRSKAPQTILVKPLPIAARAPALFAPISLRVVAETGARAASGLESSRSSPWYAGVPVGLVIGWEAGWLPEPTPEQRQSIFTDIYRVLR